MTCDFKQYGILTFVDSGMSVQPPFKLRNSNFCLVSSLTVRIFKRLTKALIRLRVCAGWSESLLVAHTTLLEISYVCVNARKCRYFSGFFLLPISNLNSMLS